MNLNTFRKVMAAAIKRIRQRKSAAHTAEHEAGLTAGREWATRWMDPVELDQISRLASSEIEVSPDGDAGDWLATKMAEALGLNPHGPHSVIRAKSVLFPDLDAVYSRAYVVGYLEGAAEVWRALKAKGSPGGGQHLI